MIIVYSYTFFALSNRAAGFVALSNSQPLVYPKATPTERIDKGADHEE
jgi:hypothetical protein